MYPDTWSDKNGSAAEALVYRRLRDETPDDWLAVHSVGLSSHRTKPWAELDFVVVGPFGVLCLEVKGGQVTAEGGSWSTNGNALKESPFQQAGGGAAALHGELITAVPPVRRTVVGHGVVFPDVRFKARGAGIDHDLIYDDDDLRRPMRDYLERLATHWHAFHGRGDEQLSRAERAAVVRFLAPSFDLIPTLRARMAEVDAELVELTRAQGRVLRGMRDQERALVRGGAGTGKTMLAADEAARFARSGQRVLLCCRSAALARHIARSVETDGVDVRSYRELLDELVDAADRRALIPDAEDRDVLDVFLPEQAMEAVSELERIGSYDALVVDEGQDLMVEGALDLLDVLLEGGLARGRWRVFLDHKQNVFEAVDRLQYDRVSGAATTQFQLFENCRNTPEINEMTALLAAVTPDETSARSGPDVVVRYVLDAKDEAGAVATVVDAWRRRGIEPRDVTVIATDDRVADRLERRWPPDAPKLVRGVDGHGESVRLATAADFKGLESQAAVVVGVKEISDRETLRALYVGCSRPRALLAVVLDERARGDFETRAVEFVRQQSEVDRE
ncbi:nuclease-related domain-containing DEAD/DEAH box helicase [Patulibacter americanus]|uniref:nuclease-related domain-containing DEAD/DEAH box helicase n=1 Tax=Patulibacter americanus TaxID=588672 RepID=UPI000410EE82|nr:nuclease-related domain-containing protein [Patulibacter americanus]